MAGCLHPAREHAERGAFHIGGVPYALNSDREMTTTNAPARMLAAACLTSAPVWAQTPPAPGAAAAASCLPRGFFAAPAGYHESGGAHTWTSWRDYVADFATRLFR